MMRLLPLILLLAFAAALYGARLIVEDAGYVLLAFDNWTVETSLWVALVLLVLAFILFYLCLRLLANLLLPGGLVAQWLSGRRNRAQQLQLQLGLQAYLEGNWERAIRVLEKAAKKAVTPQLNYLFAARAAQAQGSRQQSEQLLAEAQKHPGKAEIAIGLTQAELQIQNGKLEEALAILSRLQRQAPKHRLVATQLQAVLIQLEDWSGLIKLLPDLVKLKEISAGEHQRLLHRAYGGLLQQAGKASAELPALTAVWGQVPKKLQRNSAILASYVDVLHLHGHDSEAEKQLRLYFKRDWDNLLVRRFGQVRGKEVDKQLLLAESWLKARPNNAEVLLCLGRLSLMNQHWDKAKHYFESSVRLQPEAEAYAELARLLANLGDYEASAKTFQQALSLAKTRLPELPQPIAEVAVASQSS